MALTGSKNRHTARSSPIFIGQRKGLGIAMGYPVFVTEIRPETNEVVLGTNEEVFGELLYCNQLNFMSVPDLNGELEVTAKIRYNHKGAACRVEKIGEDRAVCRFLEPVRAITPGHGNTKSLALSDGVMGNSFVLP